VRLREEGAVVIIDLEGEVRLTESFTPALHEVVGGELNSGKTDFLLNFAKVDFMDSYAVGDLVAAYAAVRKKRGRFKLASLSPKIWLILRYSGLTRIMEVFDSEEKALKSFD
jgi:stage II sporulation protein AA (anti-sigma F factor antagonist)